MNTFKTQKKLIAFSLFIITAITFILYYPGLFGDFVFDDSANILENKKLAIHNLSHENLKSAALSGNAGPLGRPISLVTFSLNYYFTSFDPFYLKLTNLFIHLINGLLVFVISLKLFQWLSYQYKSIKLESTSYLACLVCLIWLIHPLNLTSVLYVVQRMTSLSSLFGLLAVAIYCIWRTRSITWSNTLLTLVSLTISLLASILSKESGVLFIPLIYWIELIFFQAKNQKFQPIFIKKIKLSYLLWFGIITVFFLFLYLLPPYLNPANFTRREFTLEERLLTESRVIFYYLKMFFYPLLSDLSLYHDDFIISKSLTQPITTLYSLAGLLGISLACIFLFKKHPMLLFAWGWYVISQLLESTFISLELVHEHRNYFGIIGFIVAAVYYIAQINNKKIQPFIYVLSAIYIANLAWTTWQRSEIWSNLVDHAAFEAEHHPHSERANYQLARIYMKLMVLNPNQKKIYALRAKESLENAKKSYMPSNAAWYGELHLYSEMNWKITTDMLTQLSNRQKTLPFRNNNISFLSSLSDCQIQGFCKVPHNWFIQLTVSAIENPTVNDKIKSELFKLLANYFIAVLGDFKKGEEFLIDAISLNDDINGRILLSQAYRLQGKLELAQAQVNQAKELDSDNIWINEIDIELKKINSTNMDNSTNEN